MKTLCGCLFSATFSLLVLLALIVGCYFLRRNLVSNPELDSMDPLERIDAARQAADKYGETK